MAAVQTKESRHRMQQVRLRQAMDAFQGTGVTDGGWIGENSSRLIPEPSQLKAVEENGKVVIVRILEEGGQVVVAVPNSEEGTVALQGDIWLKAYRMADRSVQAEMVGIKDPMFIPAIAVQAVLDKRSAGTTSSIKMTAVSSTGVQLSVEGSDVKRIKWNGHSGFSLARWCGANGWTSEHAVAVFEKLGIAMGKSAIVGGVYAGKKGTRGEPAPLTPMQATTLANLRDELFATKRAANVARNEAHAERIGAVVEKKEAFSGKGAKRRAADAALEANVRARKAAGAKGHRKGKK